MAAAASTAAIPAKRRWLHRQPRLDAAAATVRHQDPGDAERLRADTVALAGEPAAAAAAKPGPELYLAKQRVAAAAAGRVADRVGISERGDGDEPGLSAVSAA